MAEKQPMSNNGNSESHLVTQLYDGWLQSSRPLREPVPGPGPREDRLEDIIEMLLAELGVDLGSQHFRGTPARVARFYREFTRGYEARPAEILKTFTSQKKELIVVTGIDFHALCPHHLLLYSGTVHFGYVPDGRIVGISKIPRLVQALAARPVVQEELVADIADAFMAVLKPLGCAVKATARHECVTVRGVKCHDTAMTTLALRGVFRDGSGLVEEFHQVISEARQ